MKLHLKRMPVFTFRAPSVISMLTVAALTISATFLCAAPVRAQTNSPATLECQANNNSNGYALGCEGTTPSGNVALNCQSPNPISSNGGIYVAIAANCSGTFTTGGTTVSNTLVFSIINVDANNGSITGSGGGSDTLAVNNGLSSVSATLQGSSFSLTSSPLTFVAPGGSINVTASVLGIGLVQLATHGETGSVSVTDAPLPIFVINAANIGASASALGLFNANLACGSSVTINLNQPFPIAVPLAICSGS
ncbi:hypothetical protein [Dyella sp.]|uniref:hypothetical protein n=1 Tax=Dyella sp. TaxID=1869338 RepID=UPI002B4A65AB|nr:hypothetical protein [Dyella sp.]HKT26746.1 hypothetical protein [Dyella sp.]